MYNSKINYNLIKRALDASELRKKVISNNIANINTKGYKKSYVTFEETLNKSIYELELKSTNEKHMQYGTNYGEINVKKDKTSSMRLDGNNVDIDVEATNEAANTLMYNALISQANNRLSTTKYIINGR
ncbi:flagellar basal body rod protein FlgB [Clostridium acetireducens DSM 10703]|jgi:flagellar basal-body rod protein FlgB|uniref:Flagellar basal body rod protein FlgB n=1 Tax=Clostridium acetireducens DSM 10703 TaxID=1121290 RepID=A0A1E8F073_9CLOT|nr:flagellar basal body rod protein FlgB [Clostridium acetireducens]OFI06801.1 flagellar basal body rod protein FlgB [Clostridium acetireducens DSM 10703]